MKKKIFLKPYGFTPVKKLENGYIRFATNKPGKIKIIDIENGIAKIPWDMKKAREYADNHGFVVFLAFLDENAKTDRQRENPKYWWICPLIENEFLEKLNGRNPTYEEIKEYSMLIDNLKSMDEYGEPINE